MPQIVRSAKGRLLDAKTAVCLDHRVHLATPARTECLALPANRVIQEFLANHHPSACHQPHQAANHAHQAHQVHLVSPEIKVQMDNLATRDHLVKMLSLALLAHQVHQVNQASQEV